MEFLVSSKGGVLCCLNGHIYSRIRTGKEKIFWRCRNKYGNGCNASLTTNLEKGNPVINGIHNHEPDQPMIDLKSDERACHYHPSVWRAITWIQKEQEAVSTVLQQDALGQRNRRRVRTCHVKMQERLRNLCLDRQSNRKTIQEFLRGISWNIRLNKKQ